MSEETHFTPRSQNRHFEDPDPRAYKKQAKRQAPKGKKGKKNILLNVLLVFFCAVFVFSAYKLVSQYLVYQQADSEYEQVRELAGMPAGEQADSRPDFAALQAINPEIVGWVTVPGRSSAIRWRRQMTTINICIPHLRENPTPLAASLWIRTARQTAKGSIPFCMGII